MILEDQRVRLEPLTIDHIDKLLPVAKEDKLVQYSPSDIATSNSLREYVGQALKDQQQGSAQPYAVYDKLASNYAGCTRYMNISAANKVLEIGSTWIGRTYQGSGLNTHMKILMLDHAFDSMEYEKVEFRIDERNSRSRKAVEKLGAVHEGILRKNVYLLDGFKRNTCCYGILKEEWQLNRKKFISKL